MSSTFFFFFLLHTLQYKAIGEELQLAHYALGSSRASELVRRGRMREKRAQRVHPSIVSNEIGPWFP